MLMLRSRYTPASAPGSQGEPVTRQIMALFSGNRIAKEPAANGNSRFVTKNWPDALQQLFFADDQEFLVLGIQ